MAEKINRHYLNGIGTTLTTAFTAPAHATSGTENMSVIISLILCNTHSGTVTADVVFVPGGTSTEINLTNNVSIATGNSVEVIQSRVFMKHDGTNADVVKVRCDTGAYIDVLLSTLEGLN
tara:strand:- start:974 stop:1333 length:360 start_codon:yes stop_codon:yes gene_type:complete